MTLQQIKTQAPLKLNSVLSSLGSKATADLFQMHIRPMASPSKESLSGQNRPDQHALCPEEVAPWMPSRVTSDLGGKQPGHS